MLETIVKYEIPLLFRLIKSVPLYVQRYRTRRQLLELDDIALKDIGLTREQATQEARLFFWQGAPVLHTDEQRSIEL